MQINQKLLMKDLGKLLEAVADMRTFEEGSTYYRDAEYAIDEFRVTWEDIVKNYNDEINGE